MKLGSNSYHLKHKWKEDDQILVSTFISKSVSLTLLIVL